MNVVAVRDDGALLISDGLAAAIVSDDGEWITSQDSAVARGLWLPPEGRTVPPGIAARLEHPLAVMHGQLAAATQPPKPPGAAGPGPG